MRLCRAWNTCPVCGWWDARPDCRHVPDELADVVQKCLETSEPCEWCSNMYPPAAPYYNESLEKEQHERAYKLLQIMNAAAGTLSFMQAEEIKWFSFAEWNLMRRRLVDGTLPSIPPEREVRTRRQVNWFTHVRSVHMKTLCQRFVHVVVCSYVFLIEKLHRCRVFLCKLHKKKPQDHRFYKLPLLFLMATVSADSPRTLWKALSPTKFRESPQLGTDFPFNI
jgi:hypothetical protein